MCLSCVWRKTNENRQGLRHTYGISYITLLFFSSFHSPLFVWHLLMWQFLVCELHSIQFYFTFVSWIVFFFCLVFVSFRFVSFTRQLARSLSRGICFMLHEQAKNRWQKSQLLRVSAILKIYFISFWCISFDHFWRRFSVWFHYAIQAAAHFYLCFAASEMHSMFVYPLLLRFILLI